MAAGLMNHAKGARKVGKITIAPGTAKVIDDDSWSKNPVIVEWVKNNILEVVPVSAVDGINAGMNKKKVIAEAKAKEQEQEMALKKELEQKGGANPPPKS